MPSTWQEYLQYLQAQRRPVAAPTEDADEFDLDSIMADVRADYERRKEEGAARMAARREHMLSIGAMDPDAVEGVRNTGLAEVAARSVANSGIPQLAVAGADVGGILAHLAVKKAGLDEGDTIAARLAQKGIEGIDAVGGAVRRVAGYGPGGTLTTQAEDAQINAAADYMASGEDLPSPFSLRAAASPAIMFANEVASGAGAVKVGAGLLRGAAKKLAPKLAAGLTAEGVAVGADRLIDLTAGGVVSAAASHEEGDDFGDLAVDTGRGVMIAATIGETMRRVLARGGVRVGIGEKPPNVPDAPTTPEAKMGRAADLADEGRQILESLSEETGLERQPLRPRSLGADADEFRQWFKGQPKQLTDGAPLSPGAPQSATRQLAEVLAESEAVRRAAPGSPEAVAAARAARDIEGAAEYMGGLDNLGMVSERIQAAGLQPEPFVAVPEAALAAATARLPPEEVLQSAAEAAQKAVSGAPLGFNEAALAAKRAAANAALSIADSTLSIRGMLADPTLRRSFSKALPAMVESERDAMVFTVDQAQRQYFEAIAAYAKRAGVDEDQLAHELYMKTQYGPERARKAITEATAGKLKTTKEAVEQAWSALTKNDAKAMEQVDPQLLQVMQQTAGEWGLPPELFPAWSRMQGALDPMRALIAEVADEATAEQIKRRTWAYAHRRYAVFENPEEQLAKAKLMPEYERTLDQIKKKLAKMGEADDEVARGMLEDLILGDDDVLRYLGKSKPVSGAAKVLRRRQNVPPDVRKMRGEEADARFSTDTTKNEMAYLAARIKVMREVREAALEVGAAREKNAPGFRQASLRDSSRAAGSANLAGDVYWRKDVADTLNGMDRIFDNNASLYRSIKDAYTRTLALTRGVKIATNVASQINKVLGETLSFATAAPGFALSSKSWRSLQAGLAAGVEVFGSEVAKGAGTMIGASRAASAEKAAGKAAMKLSKIASMVAGKVMRPAELNQLMEDGMRHGVVSGSVMSELAGLYRYGKKFNDVPQSPRPDWSQGPDVLAASMQEVESLGRKAAQGGKRFFDTLADTAKGGLDIANALPNAYSAMLRVVMWDQTVLRHQRFATKVFEKLLVAQGVAKDQAAALAAEQAAKLLPQHKSLAGEEVAALMPTWSRAWEPMKVSDRLSPFSPWLTATVEPLRNYANQIRFLVKSANKARELASAVSEVPAVQALYVQKYVGDAARRAAGLTFATYAVSKLIEARQDEDMSPEQREAAYELLLMDHEMRSQTGIIDFKPGESVTMRNYGTTIPQEPMMRAMKAFTESGSTVEALAKVAEDVASWEPFFHAALEFGLGAKVPYSAKNIRESRPYTAAPPSEMDPAPRDYEADKRIKQAASRVLGADAARALKLRKGDGSRPIPDALRYRLYDTDSAVADTKKTYRDRAANKGDRTKLLELQQEIDERWGEIRAAAQRKVYAARALGVPERDIEKMVEDTLGNLRKKGKRSIMDPTSDLGFWDIYDPDDLLKEK